MTTNHLEQLQGSEIVTLEVVQFFLNRGWSVDVFTHLLGGEMEYLFQQLQHQDSLLVTDDDNYPFDSEYDIVWLQHHVMNSYLRNRLLNSGMKAQFIFNHMSSFAEMELPLVGFPENEIASNILAVSYECRDVLCQKGIHEAKVSLFDNPVPDAFITQFATPSLELKKVLFISNHRPAELNEAADLLADKGIACTFIGGSHKKVRVTPKFISDYDAVVTIGKSVQYALVAGVPVYIYDLYGGDGYLVAENLEKSHYHNFSGRATRVKRTGETLCREIMEGYENARNFVATNREAFLSRWSLQNKLAQVIDTPDQAKFVQLDDGAFREIDLHNKKLRRLTAPVWSYSKWFNTVTDDEKRLDAIEYILKSHDALAQIDVIIIDNNNSDSLRETLESIRTQKYKANKIWGYAGGESECHKVTLFTETGDESFDANLGEVVNAITAPLVLFVQAGDLLHQHALLSFAEAKAVNHQGRVFYFDEDVKSDATTVKPILKPDINIDLLRSYPYVGKMLGFEVTSLVEQGADIYHYGEFFTIAALLGIVKRNGLGAVGHIDKISFRTSVSGLAWLNEDNIEYYHNVISHHLNDLNVSANVEIMHINGNHALNISYQNASTFASSIIIIANNDVKAFSSCIQKLLEITDSLNYEIIIVSHDRLQSEVQSYLAQLNDLNIAQIKIFHWQGKFSWPAMNNMAVSHSSGDVLVFLNPDILIVDAGWLTKLSSYLIRPEVGIVGPKVINQKAQVSSAGVILGMNGCVGKIFEGESAAAAGYLNRLQVDNNVSALSHECLLIKKSLFLEADGFNTADFSDGFSEIDLALKLTQQGYCHVLVPSVRVVQLDLEQKMVRSGGTGLYDTFYERWLPALHSDPAYNRHLSRHSPGFELSPYLANVRRPLPGKPLPVVLANNIDRHGCGYYRVLHPFKALANELHIDGGTSDAIFNIPDLAEFQPDTILLQPGTRRGLSQYMEKLRKFSTAKIILDYDDYLPNIPVRSMVRRVIKQDIIKDIRKDCQQADWIVVSTEALAEEFSRFSDRIQVAPNGLSREIWGNLKSRRRTGDKIRVGWAGGATHTGDLSILKPLMKLFEHQVQWVFMGMKPQGIECEFHPGVPIEVYPEKLASLDLDLALVPLEINQFNICKSNLRLLELGACGVPIICTDIEPFRCGLPVTLVSNDFSAWVKAINEHLYNPDILSAMGDKLRETISTGWMLENALLETWKKAWTGK